MLVVLLSRWLAVDRDLLKAVYMKVCKICGQEILPRSRHDFIPDPDLLLRLSREFSGVAGTITKVRACCILAGDRFTFTTDNERYHVVENDGNWVEKLSSPTENAPAIEQSKVSNGLDGEQT